MITPQSVSPSIKYTADVGAVAFAWAHFLGFWKDNVGAIAATLSIVWLILQIGAFLKDRFKKDK